MIYKYIEFMFEAHFMIGGLSDILWLYTAHCLIFIFIICVSYIMYISRCKIIVFPLIFHRLWEECHKQLSKTSLAMHVFM